MIGAAGRATSQPNSACALRVVAAEVAHLRGMTLDALAAATTRNAQALFG